ncbi:carbonic anhydrase family protein [soil metagenome]
MSASATQQPLRPLVGLALSIVLVLGSTAGLQANDEAWSYEGDTGPAYWGTLQPAFAACSGREQSPVDIPADAPVRAEDVAYDYQPSALTIADNGHAIQVDYDEGSSVVIGDASYHLRQFHFHSPSEHTLDGDPADMELHLVHASDEGALAVIGVLLVEGTPANTALEPIWAHLPDAPGPATLIEGVLVDAADLLPDDRSYYAYPGSLTTPPCLEGVTWHVLAEPLELSAEQLATFRELHDGTNRPVQPLDDRTFDGG